MTHNILNAVIVFSLVFLSSCAESPNSSEHASPQTSSAAEQIMETSSPNRSLPPVVGEKALDFSLPTLDKKTFQLSKQLTKGPVALVILRGWPGYQCPICATQVGKFIARADDFRSVNARVAFVYPGPADHLVEHAEEFFSRQNIPDNFFFLIDPDFKFTVSYGLRWNAPKETAYPSTFIIDQQGAIRFEKVSKTHGDRASADDVLKVLAEMKE
ncbi:MAG: peroxiredoxin family protein [Candidatus Omnitrophota bacterium]